jgi:NAD(P)-dependent dehydrogenase (short-subunit alcohol dehydrogenase family)
VLAGWAAAEMPGQQGRTALVTGANSGIGFQAALELARHGAVVLMACRDPGRGAGARDALVRHVPAAAVELVALDLADLDSVARLADRVTDLDLLVNNAGVMAVPGRRVVAQGFELQFGTNHLGHFALTVRLLPALLGRPGSRVVTVSSIMHRFGSIRLDDLQREHSYGGWRAYAQSKLANALFTLELDRRLRASGAARRHRPGGPRRRLLRPRGLAEMRGAPRRTRYARAAYDEQLARSLWQASEELTGVAFPA